MVGDTSINVVAGSNMRKENILLIVGRAASRTASVPKNRRRRDGTCAFEHGGGDAPDVVQL